MLKISESAQTSHCVKLQPDAVHWCGICYGDVAVCVSVKFMYCAQTTESIIMQPYQIVAEPF